MAYNSLPTILHENYRLLAKNGAYRRKGEKCRYDLDMGGFQGLDKSLVIVVPDTFTQLNPITNLFMLGNRGDAEGMAS